MTEFCLAAGLPKPQFKPNTSEFLVVFTKDIYNKSDLEQLELNKRQIDALSFYKQKGYIIASEYAQKYNITDRTARRDLSDLSEKKLLKNEGENKLSRYVFP